MSFTADRALLSPKFEGYKLQAIEQSDVVASHELPAPATEATVSGRSVLSLPEVAARIQHNHLAVGHNHRAAYVDATGCVQLITLDEETVEPRFHRLFEIPHDVRTDAQLEAEYACAASLDAAHWVVSDGRGRLYIVRTTEENVPGVRIHGALLAAYEYVTHEPPSSLLPCRMHVAARGPDGAALVVLSSKVRDAGKSPRFDVCCVRLVVPSWPDVLARPLELLWQRTGPDIPLFAEYDAQADVVLLGGSCPYLPSGQVAPSFPVPAPDERAPVPRAGENLDDPPVITHPPPYSWTQTGDSLTVAIPLPATTQKHGIKVHFSPRTLSLSIHDAAGVRVPDAPFYSLRAFWDGISPSASFWTWEAGGHAVGLLTLHLDKQHEGTRWPHVFAEGDEVNETLDPSELWAIRESLEKYTSALGTDSEGPFGGPVPSLAGGELDDELDTNVGAPLVLTPLATTSTAAPAADTRVPVPAALLARALPGSGAAPALVLKNGLDGLLFAPRADAGAGAGAWVHSATYPALAFVLASKRELRFTHHVGARAILACESSARGNAYVYAGAPPGARTAAQGVLRISGGDAGALLGIGALQTGGGQLVVLGLCERQLVVVRGIA